METSNYPESRPGTSGTQSRTTLTYKKTPSRCTISGQMFEIKLAAISFLRLVNNEDVVEFQLASNVDGADALDDLIVRLRTTEKWKTVFVQQKFKETAQLKQNSLNDGKKSIFPFNKYQKSHRTIQETMNNSSEVLFNGSFDDCHFVLYTNAELENKLKKFKIASSRMNNCLQGILDGHISKFNSKASTDDQCKITGKICTVGGIGKDHKIEGEFRAVDGKWTGLKLVGSLREVNVTKEGLRRVENSTEVNGTKKGHRRVENSTEVNGSEEGHILSGNSMEVNGSEGHMIYGNPTEVNGSEGHMIYGNPMEVIGSEESHTIVGNSVEVSGTEEGHMASGNPTEVNEATDYAGEISLEICSALGSIEIFNFLKTSSKDEQLCGLKVDTSHNLASSQDGKLNTCEKLLDSLTMFYGQATGVEMDKIIKDELIKFVKKCDNTEEHELETIFLFCQKDFIDWWQDSDVILDQDSSIVQGACDRYQMNILSIKLEKEMKLSTAPFHSKFLDVLSDNEKPMPLLFVSHKNSSSLISSQIIQKLNETDTFYLLFELKSLLELELEQRVMLAWQSRKNTTLVIVAQSGRSIEGDYEDKCVSLCNTLKVIAMKYQKPQDRPYIYPLIVISPEVNPFASIVRRELFDLYKEVTYKGEFRFLNQNLMTMLSNREVTFQGSKMPMGDVLKAHLSSTWQL